MAYRITTVCRAGVGTSAFAKKLVQDAVEEMGYDRSQFLIDSNEVMFAKGIRDGVIITQTVLLDKLKANEKVDAVIGLDNIIRDKEQLIEQLTPVLAAAEAAGKIKKRG